MVRKLFRITYSLKFQSVSSRKKWNSNSVVRKHFSKLFFCLNLGLKINKHLTFYFISSPLISFSNPLLTFFQMIRRPQVVGNDIDFSINWFHHRFRKLCWITKSVSIIFRERKSQFMFCTISIHKILNCWRCRFMSFDEYNILLKGRWFFFLLWFNFINCHRGHVFLTFKLHWLSKVNSVSKTLTFRVVETTHPIAFLDS